MIAARKTCTKCSVAKPHHDFSRRTASRDGLDTRCKECRRRYCKAWYVDNAEKQRQAQRAYRATGEVDQDSADRVRNWRAKQQGCFVERVSSLVVLELDDGVCGICGEDVDPFSFDVDHVIPTSRGGEHSYANTQVAHRACNQHKTDRFLWDIERAVEQGSEPERAVDVEHAELPE